MSCLLTDASRHSAPQQLCFLADGDHVPLPPSDGGAARSAVGGFLFRALDSARWYGVFRRRRLSLTDGAGFCCRTVDLDLEELKQSLRNVPGVEEVVFVDDHRSLLQSWANSSPPEFVFNQADEFLNDEEMEGAIASLLDMLQVPYVGPNATGTARSIAESIDVG
jgi:hypothetical protein